MALSIQLIIILFILFIFNLYFINNNKWTKVFYCFFLILMFVPIEIQELITGSSYSQPGILNISLAGYDMIIIIICSIILKRKLKKITKKKFLLLILCILTIIGIRFITEGISAISNKILDNYLLPLIMAIYMISYLSKDDLHKLLKFIYKLILINAIIACVEYFVGKSLFFHNHYITNIDWYKNIYNSTFYNVKFRSTALLGHPLTNGLYYIIGIIYLYNKCNMKITPLTLIQFVILSLAIISTNSRIDLMVYALISLYMLKNTNQIGKIIILLLLATIIVFILKIDFKSLYYSFFSRDSSGSSIGVRIAALRTFFKIPLFTLIFGTGFNNTSKVLIPLGFTTNLEISYLIILLENGIIAFISWLTMLSLLYNKNIDNYYNGINYKKMIKSMLICVFIVSATSNSIGDPGTLNYIFISIISFSSIMYQKNRVGENNE